MKALSGLVIVFALLAGGVSGQNTRPITDLVADGIPGVIAPGEKVELVTTVVKRADDVIGFHDGNAVL